MPDDAPRNEPDNTLTNRDAQVSGAASEHDEIPSISEILARAAETGQQEIIQTIATLQMRVGVPLDRSLLDKLDNEHLADMIAIQSDELKLDYEDRKKLSLDASRLHRLLHHRCSWVRRISGTQPTEQPAGGPDNQSHFRTGRIRRRLGQFRILQTPPKIRPSIHAVNLNPIDIHIRK